MSQQESERASLPQCVAIEWMWRHGCEINARGRFSIGAWADVDAKSEMRSAARIFGAPAVETSGANDTARYLCGDATPKVRKATVSAMLRRGWVEPTRDEWYVITASGKEAYFRSRAGHQGKKVPGALERKRRPRNVGLVEIRRRGGPEAAKRSMDHHRRLEAEHKRVADHIEASLELWKEDVASRQADWRDRKSG